MSRWKQQDATVCIFGTVNCAFGENASDARRIVTEHNTDCDVYEEKIAELQRRMDAVVAIVGLEQQGEFEDWPAGEHLRALRDVRAIAEGREG